MRSLLALPLALAASLAAQPNRTGALPPLYDTTPSRPTATPARPPGFTVAARSGSVGQALTATLPAATSARQAFRGTWRTMASYFDGAPAIVGAYGDPRDQQVQVLFRAGYRGARVTGLALVAVSAGQSQAALVFDQVEQVSRSFPVLLRALGGTASATSSGATATSTGVPAAVQPLTPTVFPDGSGTIGLAPGWRIGSSYKGIVDAAGPQGQLLILGYYQQVMTSWFGPPPATPGYIQGPYRDPLGALQQNLDSYLGGALRRGTATFRLIEQVPVAAPAGRASYISYELQTQGRSAIALAMVSTTPIDATTWVYYLSSVAAPRERFARDFPTMWAMWKSWSVNPAVFRERMDATLSSMRETYRLLRETNENTQRTYDRVNHAWSQTIRGVSTIEHTGTGWRGDVDTNYVDQLVRGLNEQGWDWRIVPMRDLLP